MAGSSGCALGFSCATRRMLSLSAERPACVCRSTRFHVDFMPTSRIFSASQLRNAGFAEFLLGALAVQLTTFRVGRTRAIAHPFVCGSLCVFPIILLDSENVLIESSVKPPFFHAPLAFSCAPRAPRILLDFKDAHPYN
jgi:hypothetical protein